MKSVRAGGWLLLTMALGACASRIPMQRTLPEWVHNVFVPMFQNASPEPGLEELGTRFANEEFLADGRLRIVSKVDADLVVGVKVKTYLRQADNFESDRFMSTAQIAITAHVILYEPSDLKTPYADLGDIIVESRYLADPRRSRFIPDVDAKKDAMRALAREVVLRVITGFTPESRSAYDKIAKERLDAKSVRSSLDYSSSGVQRPDEAPSY